MARIKTSPRAAKWISDKISKLDDEGITGERAQAIAINMARERFPGEVASPPKKKKVMQKTLQRMKR